MRFLNRYKIIIAVVGPILILVLIRQFGSNHFQTDAKKWAEPSFAGTNIVSTDQASSLHGKRLIISLDKKIDIPYDLVKQAQFIPADSILAEKNLDLISDTGHVLLWSADNSVTCRIWMILSQMGYKNIYILSGSPDNEVFKYKFRPDTLVSPEL